MMQVFQQVTWHPMNRTVRPLLLSLFLLSGATPAMACAILPPEQVAQKRQEGLETMRTEARALMNEADQVFVGYLGKLTFNEETREPQARIPLIAHVHQAYFRNVRQIKGTYDPSQPLEFVTIQNRVTIGCGGEFRDTNPGEHGAGETYLVYAKTGKILRTNRLPYVNYSLMDGQQEADFLRKADK